MWNFLKNDKCKYFALGVVAATAGVQFLKSKVFHDGCVRTVAQGKKLREDAAASLSKIKEDAEDLRFDQQTADECAEVSEG